MQKKINLRLLRISSKKMQSVSRQIKGKNLKTILNLLYTCDTLAAKILFKTISYVVANIKVKEEELHNIYVKKIYVNKGPYLKKIYTRSQGRVNYIKKKRSHITVFIDNN